MNVGVVIAAGGVGKRMKGACPKQFMEILGKPMIAHTLDRFLSAKIEDLVVVVPQGWEDEIKKILSKYPPAWKIAQGGLRRQDSVLNGIDALGSAENVLIHDAARPFVRPALIKKAADMLEKEDAVLVALPSRDTVKEVEHKVVIRTLSRHRVWLAQTPQGARTKLIREAISNAQDVTDDAMALEAIGIMPVLIEGDPWNLKITTYEDMVIAEAIAERISKDESWHRI